MSEQIRKIDGETAAVNTPEKNPEKKKKKAKKYEITVKAYKNGEMLVSKLTLVFVEGNILDELRTRIRNNG